MRIKRLLVGAIGAALVVASPLALSTNAQAADSAADGFAAVSTPATTAPAAGSTDTALTESKPAARQRAATFSSRLKMRPQARTVYRYKQTVLIAGQIQAKPSETVGSCQANTWCYVSVDDDSVKLYRRVAGTKTWKFLGAKGGSNTGTFKFATPSVGVAAYRLEYSGSPSLGVPAATTTKTIRGSRNTHARAFKRSGKIYAKGNVDPGWGNKPVVIQRKSSPKGTWRKWKSIRTTRNGAFQVRLPSPRSGNYYYRVMVKASAPRWSKTFGGGWRVFRR